MQKTCFPNTYDTQTAVLSNEEVAEAHYLLRCECPEIAQDAQAGQFVHVMVSPGTGLLLRRPFTIYTVEGTQITMLYQIIGEGTKLLSEMPIGTRLQVLGPLGKPFDIVSSSASAILVGGGAGIASLMLLAVALRTRGIPTLAFVGARHQARLLSVTDLEALGIAVHIATDDGSVGHHGDVTELLRECLGKTDGKGNYPPSGARPPTQMFACGPHGMLSAVAQIAAEVAVPTQVAMENRMGCAMGVCLGCVCPVRVEVFTPLWGSIPEAHQALAPLAGDGIRPTCGDYALMPKIAYARVCTEGPVFNASDIVWERS